MDLVGFGKRLLASVGLVAGGCGTLPEFFVDAGRDAAKETLRKSVEETVERAVNGVVEELWDLSGVSPPPEADDEGKRDADGGR